MSLTIPLFGMLLLLSETSAPMVIPEILEWLSSILKPETLKLFAFAIFKKLQFLV